MISKDQLAAAVGEIRAGIGGVQQAVDTLQSYIDSWDPEEPPASKIRYAQHKYDNSTPTDFSKFDVYDVQRGFRVLESGINPEAYIFTCYVKRPTDTDGLTQFLRPTSVPSDWLARTTAGELIRRDQNGGEYLIDITNQNWQSLAIPQIASEAGRLGVEGVYLDEVDQTLKWAWPMLADGKKTAQKFPNDQAWQGSLSGFIDRLASHLHANNLKLWINLGADYDVTVLWQSELLRRVDGVNIEFFVGREGVGATPAVDADWLRGIRFVRDAEAGFGVPVHVHCSSMNQAVVDYSFVSWLLATEFKGSFSASLDYGGTTKFPNTTFKADAELLGAPQAAFGQNSFGQYVRQFDNGTVAVNSTNSLKGSLPARTGRITLDES